MARPRTRKRGRSEKKKGPKAGSLFLRMRERGLRRNIEKSAANPRQARRIVQNVRDMPGSPKERVALMREVKRKGLENVDIHNMELAARHQVPLRHFPLFSRRVNDELARAREGGVGRSEVFLGLPREPRGLGLASDISASVSRNIRGKQAKAAKLKKRERPKAPKKRYDNPTGGELGLFHLTGTLPEKGMIWPSRHYYKGQEARGRTTVHFTVNSLAGQHGGGSWLGKGVGVYVPYSKGRDYLHTANVIDSYGIGPFRLPHGSEVFVTSERSKRDGLKDGQGIGRGRVRVLDTDKHRQELFKKGEVDSHSAERFYSQAMRQAYKETYGKDFEEAVKSGYRPEYGTMDDYRSFLEGNVLRGLGRGKDSKQGKFKKRVGELMGIREDVGNMGKQDLMDSLGRHPQRLYNHYGINEVPREVRVGEYASPFHYGIEQSMKARGMPMYKAGGEQWYNHGYGNAPNRAMDGFFEREGFSSRSRHFHSDASALELLAARSHRLPEGSLSRRESREYMKELKRTHNGIMKDMPKHGNRRVQEKYLRDTVADVARLIRSKRRLGR
jgi:hypothetical protein